MSFIPPPDREITYPLRGQAQLTIETIDRSRTSSPFNLYLMGWGKEEIDALIETIINGEVFDFSRVGGGKEIITAARAISKSLESLPRKVGEQGKARPPGPPSEVKIVDVGRPIVSTVPTGPKFGKAPHTHDDYDANDPVPPKRVKFKKGENNAVPPSAIVYVLVELGGRIDGNGRSAILGMHPDLVGSEEKWGECAKWLVYWGVWRQEGIKKGARYYYTGKEMPDPDRRID